uniref:DNA/RNA non-specific endonuclease domain-containing protein n=1 Tax=Strigamia maritima TaxID=126957 RepID=T1IT42_STRMM
MANIRLLCLITTGLGCYYTNSLDKWRQHAFTVKAQPMGRHTTRPARPDLATGSADVFIPTHKSPLLCRLGRFGLPERDILMDYYDFEISYDNLTKIPNWVAEHLTYDNLKQSETKCYVQGSMVQKEDRVHPYYQSTALDYNSANAEFTKGFLLSGKSHQHAEESIRHSARLSNIAPLSKALAQNATWSDLEAFTRYLTSQYLDVYVFSGPIFIPNSNSNYMEYEVIGDNQVAVPTHFFKIIIGRCKEDIQKLSIGCYIIPNDSTVANHQINEYRVCLLELERKAGFKLFDEGFCPYSEDLMTADEFVQNKVNLMAQVGLTL